MDYPCPFCGKSLPKPRSTIGHFRVCVKYKRWRATHTWMQFYMFMRTGWRRQVFHPDFSVTRPVRRLPKNLHAKSGPKKKAKIKKKKSKK